MIIKNGFVKPFFTLSVSRTHAPILADATVLKRAKIRFAAAIFGGSRGGRIGAILDKSGGKTGRFGEKILFMWKYSTEAFGRGYGHKGTAKKVFSKC